MKQTLYILLMAIPLLSACGSGKSAKTTTHPEITASNTGLSLPAANDTARSLMELPQSTEGGFVLAPGFYEAEFKTYCLQPGTPDPRPGDAYLQGPVTGKRKEIVESILLNSRVRTEIPQRNIQLLLWSVVSGADFDKLSADVRSDALKLLTPAQVFKLKGGVGGLLKDLSANSGLVHGDMKKLLELGAGSYEAYEKIAVLREPSRILRKGVSYDQWYRQVGNYYLRYLPASYQKVKIQVFVPAGLLDTANKINGDYLFFDPTGQQAIPAFTNAQRLGIGAPVLDILRKVIQVSQRNPVPVRSPKKPQTLPPVKKTEPSNPKGV